MTGTVADHLRPLTPSGRVLPWRIRLEAYGARLESGLGSRPHEFESRILRHRVRFLQEPDLCTSQGLATVRYQVDRDAANQPIRDVNGRATIREKREKGIDVLCAFAVVREAQQLGHRVVILASHDSDLEPALDEAVALNRAKVETMRWDSPDRHPKQLRCRQRLWNTRLDERAFRASRGLNPYS